MNRSYIASLASLLVLSACSGSSVKDTLGIGGQAPDEFRVVSRPPLSVPPQFDLRTPSIGDNASNPYAADRQARAIVTGQGTPVAGGGETFLLKTTPGESATVAKNPAAGASTAESQFLQKAGAASADPTVRKTLVEEKYTMQEKREEKSWWNFWDHESDKKETTVDADKEAQRVKENKAAGKPVTEGETPVVKPKDTGVLGHILGD